MRKYEDVDIVATLGTILEINTEYYKSDFQYDIDAFKKAAVSSDADNKRLIWMSRQSGTECFLERDVFVEKSSAYSTWNYYAGTKDTVLAYAVEITGLEKGIVKGNLFELDYRQQVKQLKRDAQPPVDVTLFLADGTEQRLSYEEYNDRWFYLVDQYGPIQRTRYEVEDEGKIQQAMKSVQAERKKYTPAVFKLCNRNRKPSVLAQLQPGGIPTSQSEKSPVGIQKRNHAREV